MCKLVLCPVLVCDNDCESRWVSSQVPVSAENMRFVHLLHSPVGYMWLPLVGTAEVIPMTDTSLVPNLLPNIFIGFCWAKILIHLSCTIIHYSNSAGWNIAQTWSYEQRWEYKGCTEKCCFSDYESQRSTCRSLGWRRIHLCGPMFRRGFPHRTFLK
jgi:hypothetical protein